MTLALTGLSHHTSPLELREKLALEPDRVPPLLHHLKRQFPGGGAVLISTCNRVEVYLRAEEAASTLHAAARQVLAEASGLDEDHFQPHLYEESDRAVVAHLFKVASSLDSLVVGEQQILGQVHDAFLIAQAENTTEKILSQLFQRAFKVAKEVRTKTSIGAGKVSVASVAVDLAVSIFMSLADKTVLVLGSGETGELTLRHLVDQGARRVMVANRTLQSAEALAGQYQGDALTLEALPCHLHRADIVISSTSAPQPILHQEDFERALRQRNQKPMFVIDIAVPRDIDHAVNDLDNVYLYDIDDLQQVADQNLELRRAEISHALEIVEDQVDAFMKWRHGLFAEPTIVSMAQELNAIRQKELERTLKELGPLSPEQQQAIDYLTQRIVNKILQRPLTQLKEEVALEDPHRVLHLVKRLFGLEERHS